MLFPFEALRSDLVRAVGLWRRQVLTATETSGWLLDRFAFAVRDFPDARPAVCEALDSVPALLIAGMAERLARCRRPGGGWHWPPAGPGLPKPGPARPWGVAGGGGGGGLGAPVGWVGGRVGGGGGSGQGS